TVIGVDAELTNQEGIPKPCADKEAEESYLVDVETHYISERSNTKTLVCRLPGDKYIVIP
ncbi:MAG: hypothetical protein OXT65_02350, partial [Alphaproteobacteria bacterium]|nr:hypothetical protein [Alphaproteobacteria bacterium]